MNELKMKVDVIFRKKVYDAPDGNKIDYVDVIGIIQGQEINLKKVTTATYNLLALLAK